MDYTEINDNIIRKKYESSAPYPNQTKRSYDYVTDEERSVKWNREQVDLYNLRIDELKKEYMNSRSQAYHAFKEDCKSFIREELNQFSISDAAVDAIYSQAYEDGHSAGLQEVLICCDTYVDLIYKVLSSR